MESSDRQSNCIINGNWGELRALEILNEKFNDVQYVNELIDFYADDGIPIEVKTCQEWINRVDDIGELRHGRFTFVKEQHEYLLCQDGYYLFIVRNGDMIVRSRLLKADDVFAWMSNFRRQMTWRCLLG